MNQRPNQGEYSDYVGQYLVNVPEEGELHEVLKAQTEEAVAFFDSLTEEQGNYRYAPDKWSIKQVLGHLIDADRIMSYRLFRITRGDSTPLPGFEENDYVSAGNYDAVSLKELIGRYQASRQSTISLYESIPDDAWTNPGNVNGNPITARAKACLIIGHERHHLNIIKERYLN